MELPKTKIAYSILYGVVPYLKDRSLTKLAQCKYYNIGFD